MSGNQFSFGCTALMGTNKAGVLRPTEDGYYPMVLGAFDAYNSQDQFYPIGPVQELFAPTSALQRRIKNGALRGEYGHPRKLPGMTDRDFLARIADILESNVSHHIRNVTLLPQGMRDEQGRPVVGVVGEIKPGGPQGSALQASLDNPAENVCFSIRSITTDRYENGRYNKYLRAIYTWDYVNEPGMNVAKKWRSPALEQLQEVIMDAPAMRAVARSLGSRACVGMESQYAASLRRVMQDLGFEADTESAPRPSIIVPPTSRW
jgi:hypothetical protein